MRGSRDIEHESSAHSLATVQVLKATTSSTSRPDQRTIRANLPSVSRRRCVGRRSDGYLSRPIPATEAEPSPRSKMQVRTKLAQVGSNPAHRVLADPDELGHRPGRPVRGHAPFHNPSRYLFARHTTRTHFLRWCRVARPLPGAPMSVLRGEADGSASGRLPAVDPLPQPARHRQSQSAAPMR